MKKTFPFLLIVLTMVYTRVHGQGWYVEVDLDLNHGRYAFENISNATLTFSGVTVSGSSTNSNLHLIVKGTGSISGMISLSVNGTAYEPYDRNDPYSQPLSIQYSGKYDVLCQTGFFEKKGYLPESELYIWIRIYPRLVISDFIQLCDQITLTTTTCSPSFRWEVSDSPTGNFRTLEGKTTPSIIVKREEIINLGFADPYGRKYFRVTGLSNTTSELQPIEIYYPGPTASIQMSPPKCHNAADGSITVNIQSARPSEINDFVITLFKSVPPQDQLLQDFINDNSQKTFSGLKSGSYWIRIENNSNTAVYGNCWTDYAAGTLEDPEPVTMQSEVSDYNGYSVRCAGSKDGMITVIPSGGSGTYSTFEWSPQVSMTSTASELSAGQFQVKVTDSNGCSSAILTSVITEPPKLAVNVVSMGGRNGYDVSCHNKADGKLMAEVSGGVGGYSYLWSNRNITSWINDLAPGSYSVSVSDGNGCKADATVSLVAPAPIHFSIKEINGINCPGDKTGALEIASISNTIGQTFFSWSSGEFNKAIADKGSGHYTATVSDEQGCSTPKSHTLNEPAVHTAEIIAISDFNGTPIQCNGTATGQLRAVLRDATGSVVSGQDFTWYRDGLFYQSGQHLESLAGVDAATYQAEIRYTTHCTSKATYVLSEPESLKTNIMVLSDYNGAAIRCDGGADGSIKAEASGGTGVVSFRWSTGETNHVLTGLSKGSYEVTATDENGCSAQTAIILDDPPPFEVSISIVSDYHGAPISCSEASDGRLGATAKGGTGPYTFTWSNGYTGTEATNLAAGTHSVTAIDGNGCQAQNESTIVAPAPLRAAIIDLSDYHGYGTSCAGSADGFMRAEVSGGTGEYTFHWSETGATTPLNAGLHEGRYTVSIRDENGCDTFAEAFITEPDPVAVYASSLKEVSCHEGNDGEIELTASGGTGTYTYSADGKQWQTEPLFTNLRATVHNTVVQDENACMASATHTLTQPLPIEITFKDVVPALCGEAKGGMSATVTGGTEEYQYLWTDANANIVSKESTASKLNAGIYLLTVTDAHQCRATRTAGISSTDGPVIHIADITGTSCSYTDDGKARVEIVSGSGPFTFRWQEGQTTSEAVRLARGNHIVEVRDTNNCAAVTSVIVPSPDSLTIEISEQIQPQCFGDCNGSITVLGRGGTGPYTYDWGSAAGQQLNNLCSGTYTVSVTDSNQCIANRNFELTQPDELTINTISQKAPGCPEDCDGLISVQATGGTGELSYKWSHGQAGNLVTNLCADRFTAHVTDSRGCAVTETFTLEAPGIPLLDLGGSVTLCEGQTHTLDAGPQWKDHLWSSNNGFRSESRHVTLSEAALYWIEATTFEGCVARDTFLLQTSTDLLKASFLMPSEAATGDTVVIIDISWPMPEKADWKFPDTMVRLQAPPDIVYGRFDSPGSYPLGLTTTLGACRDELFKTITILSKKDDGSDAGRFGTDPFVKQFALYPNPNDGMFDIVVELREQSPITLTIWNVLTSKIIARFDRPADTDHQQHVDLRPLSAGTYSLRLDYSHGTKYIRFIVN